MRKSIHLFMLILVFVFLSFSTMTAVPSGVYINDMRKMLIEQLKAYPYDVDEILKGLQSTEGLVYKLGSRGNGVREFQSLLISNGYSIGKADGAYGSKTNSAVMEFQSANNLPVTGEADLITQLSLVMNNSSFTRKRNKYIAQVKNYAVIIWPRKAFYVGVLDKSGNLLEGTYYYFSNYLNGGYYAGEYKNNQRSGKGTAHFTNGDVYAGEWKNDAMNGYGTYTFYSCVAPGQYFSSHEYYKGNMLNNKMHGKGIYYVNGTRIPGRWSNNRFVR